MLRSAKRLESGAMATLVCCMISLLPVSLHRCYRSYTLLSLSLVTHTALVLFVDNSRTNEVKYNRPTTPPLCLLDNSRALYSAPLLVNMVLLIMLDEVQMVGTLK